MRTLVTLFLEGAHLDHTQMTKAILTGVRASRAIFDWAMLYKANLQRADLQRAWLHSTNLTEADLTEANLSYADLTEANLREARLTKVKLRGARLTRTNLSAVNLCNTDLQQALLVQTNLSRANLSGAYVYGISAWDVKLSETLQSDLIISERGMPVITVDNLVVAQFVHLLLHNEKIRDVIDILTTKSVLLLGRFTPERKAVLDAIRETLRTKKDRIPILFDFDKSIRRNLTETVTTLARLVRFVIVDLSDPSCSPHELMSFVPDLPSVFVQPIIEKGKHPYAMFQDLFEYSWVMPLYEYENQDQLIADLSEKIIEPVEAKVEEKMRKRMKSS